MFEVGKTYEFRVLEGGDEISFVGIIETYEHPTIKLEDTPPMKVRIAYGPDDGSEVFANKEPIPGRIINVTSPNFIGAQEQREEQK